MSAKWIRSKQWDDQNIPTWAWPLRFLLRAFSSITLAVILLSLVVLYGILASIPVGLIVLGLTYVVYGLTVLATIGVVAAMPLLVLRRAWRPATSGQVAVRFAVSLLGGVALAGLAVQLWHTFAWPRLVYDPETHAGLRLFPGFVSAYRSVTLRRLPGMEMSELEFYSWWPLRVILLLFVINMVTATVRRIEFIFPNIGVLTVHTGIVLIALGSVYYSNLKQEGDTLLMAGEPGPDGLPTPGLPQTGFYDNTRVALWTRVNDRLWEQRPIRPPRYNDYNLDASDGMSVDQALRASGEEFADADGPARSLHQPVPRPANAQLDEDLSFTLVGYATYADPVPTWVKTDAPAPGAKPQPVRFADLVLRIDDSGKPTNSPRIVPFYFVPDDPAARMARLEGQEGEPPVFGIEYTRAMPAQRFADLTAELPPKCRHALIVDVPAAAGRPPFHAVYDVRDGAEIKVGDTGYTLQVKQLLDKPPFPIITAGYRGTTSSVAVVHVVPPVPPIVGPPTIGASASPASKPFDRYVYHRFPEIDQDLLDELNDRGMPKRRDADPAIRIAYIDASKLQVYINEPAPTPASTPNSELRTPNSLSAIIRQPGGPARIVNDIQPGGTIADLMPGLDLRLGERWDNAEEVEHPRPVPEPERKKDEIGNHEHAMLAVQITSSKPSQSWKKVVWLPFTKYLAAGLGTERTVALPDGRDLTLAFGRIRYTLPGFMIQLMDFKMIAYENRGSPRDYQSTLRVVPTHDGAGPAPFQIYTHLASLNSPLQAPFHWDDSKNWFVNAFGTLASRLSPKQFKFSQAGWDQEGWRETQQATDAGQLPRPSVRFTILGVGNNPGIHIIALGAIMMSVGIPWAFYIKPLILKRRRNKLKAEHAKRDEASHSDIPNDSVGELAAAQPAGARP